MNPYDLHIKPGWNVAREMDDPEIHAHIDWLARDIANVGVKQPYRIHHEEGNFYITDGHLRHHAVFRAMNKYGATIMSVPVILGPPGETEKDRTCMMLRANSGLGLKPWGKGALMKRLVDWGWSDKQIADEFHCSRGRVRQLLELQTLPDSIAAFIRKGIAADHVMTTFKAMGEEKAAIELGSEVVYAKAIGAKRVMPKHGREARLGSGEDTAQRARAVKPSKLSAILAIMQRCAVSEEGEQWVMKMSIPDGLALATLTGMELPEGLAASVVPRQEDSAEIDADDDSASGPRVSAMAD
jgi:ParB-like chromosome segregation protein Spo0J